MIQDLLKRQWFDIIFVRNFILNMNNTESPLTDKTRERYNMPKNIKTFGDDVCNILLWISSITSFYKLSIYPSSARQGLNLLEGRTKSLANP